MKIPYSWIKRFLTIEQSPEEIAEFLTLAGLEVEKIDRLHFSFEGVIIGLIKEVHPHENADKLRVARVSDGKKEHIVVCGAPQLPVGKKVAFAPIGARLYIDSPSPFTLSKAKIRGVESKGMLCSEKELGLGNNHDSLFFLDDSAPLGVDFISYFKDPIFDITLTPNLGHCRSVFGICRELSRLSPHRLEYPQVHIDQSTGKQVQDFIHVSNETEEKCPQFAVRIVSGIEVKPSPSWMRDLLEKVGINPINNIVDITNYVLHEIGQPLHAYDYSTLPEKSLTVREAKRNESIVTLDGKERTLEEGQVIISSNHIPVAIGGIMGGAFTQVSPLTHTVVLEAAVFCKKSIRKTSGELKLRTEASSRFENEVDTHRVLFALDYAAFLMQEIAGASIVSGVIHKAINPFKPTFHTVRLSRINHILGTKLSLSEVETFLISLGFTASSDGEDLFQLKIPSWRNDIESEIDIIEEVARVYGYNNIEVSPPKHITSLIPHHPLYLLERLLRKRLCLLGLQEFLTCSLISKQMCGQKIDHGLFEVTPIEVIYAKSVDQSLLRPSLLPGLLSSMLHNKNNGNPSIAAFEIGNVFSKTDETYLERLSLGILLSGSVLPHHFDKKDETIDFLDLKGILCDLFSSLNIDAISFSRSKHITFHPGFQANISIDGNVIATFGKLHPELTTAKKLPEETFFAEVDLCLIEHYRIKEKKFKKLPILPSSIRDVTFTIEREKELARAFDLISKSPFPELKSVVLKSIYIDEEKTPEKKNVTFSFTYRDDINTLDDHAIQSCHEKVVAFLSKAL